MISTRSNKRQSGIALFMVILGLVVFSVLALDIEEAIRANSSIARSDLGASEMSSYFDAVILTVAESLSNTAQNAPRVDGVPSSTYVINKIVPIVVISEFGKVDLNASDIDTLQNLCAAAGSGPSEANEEAQQIFAWRSVNINTNNDRLFRTTTEIMQVSNITLDMFQKISPAITVYSGRDRIDASTAPLLALEAAGMDTLTAEALIQDRSDSKNSKKNGEVVDGRISKGINVTGWAFTIQTTLSLGKRRELASAIIRLTGDPKSPYVELWQKLTPA